MNLLEEPPDHGIGRSRGGLTTKIHHLCDGKMRPLVMLIGPGQGGTPQCSRTCWTPSAFPGWVRAGPVPVRTGPWRIRRTPQGPTGIFCAGAASRL